MKNIQNYEPAKQEGKILLNANEKTTALPADILEEVLRELRHVDMNRYPDAEERELLQAYGRAAGLKAEQLLAGNGSDQMLGFMIGTFLGKDRVLYTFDPDFSMYDYYAGTYEAKVCKFDINEDGSLDIDAFIRCGRENNAGLVMFSNPNNPSGHCLSINEIGRILEGFADIPVVVDEAYIEFADEESAVSLLADHANLYVTRTLSKAFGLAGVRVGFLISSAENMAALKSAFVPYTLNALSMKTASVVLRHMDRIRTFTEEIRSERKRMYDAVKNFSRARFIASQANFLYGSSADKERLLQLLKEKEVVIRDYAGTDRFRITVGTAAENDIVLSVLQTFEEEKSCGQ